jgi:uncharacterized protein YbjT (DUF2867 family)
MSKEVLVIGGTGFIGTHVCNRLNKAGYNVTAGVSEKRESKYLDSEVDIELADITYQGSLKFGKYDTAINLAGLSPLFKPSDVSYYDIHVEGVENIIEEAERADLDHFIHMSAYGADPNAETEYLRTKGAGQKLVEDSELETCVFRPSIVLGKGSEFETLFSHLRRLPVAVLPGNPVFQPIDMADVADIFLYAVEKGLSGVFDIGGEEVLSMKDMVKRRFPDKPVLVSPSALTRIGLQTAEFLPLPFGIDQYKSLQMDNSLEKNDAEGFLDSFRRVSV